MLQKPDAQSPLVLGLCRPAGVHAEVVLQRDGGEGLRRGLDLHVLLGLDGLVESVRVAASSSRIRPSARRRSSPCCPSPHTRCPFRTWRRLSAAGSVHALRLDRVVVDHLVAFLRFSGPAAFSSSATSAPMSGITKNPSSLKYFDSASWPLSVSSTELSFSSMTK